MAVTTAAPVGMTVAPLRQHGQPVLRFLGALLILAALVIALGFPLLLSGITGFRLSVGQGESMEPTFYENDFLITRSTALADLRPGDIVSFKSGDKRVMHRLLSVRYAPDGRGYLITRGDNNDVNDPPVPESALAGKLIYDVAWLPNIPVDLSGHTIFYLEWAVSVGLVSLGVVLRRPPGRPSRAQIRRSFGVPQGS